MTGLGALPHPLAGLAVSLAMGLANFVAILMVVRALAPSDPMAARARQHAARRRDLRAALLAPKGARRRKPIGLARQLLDRLKLGRGAEAGRAAENLAKAGWRSRDAVTIFLTLRLAAPLLLAITAYELAPALMPHLTGTHRLFAAMAGLAAGAYLPKMLLKNAIQKRQGKIHKGLADGLDLFVICAEAGLSLDAAVTRVAREIGPSAPELADELGLTAIELGFLPDRREALLNLSRRVDTTQVRGLVNTLVQTEKYGTPLAQALRSLAGEFRDTRMMKAEEKAARLPAILTVPMIIFVLPPLFVVLIGPAIVQVLKTSFH
jgi:tight adherence protein C